MSIKRLKKVTNNWLFYWFLTFSIKFKYFWSNLTISNWFRLYIDQNWTFQSTSDSFLSNSSGWFKIQLQIGFWFSIEIRDDYKFFWNPSPSRFSRLSLPRSLYLEQFLGLLHTTCFFGMGFRISRFLCHFLFTYLGCRNFFHNQGKQ